MVQLIQEQYPDVEVIMGTATAGLTFLTVMGFLGPVFGYGGMFLGGNLWLHLLLPVASMVGYLFLDSDVPLPFRKTPRAVTPMLVYAVGYLGNILIQGVGEWPHRHDFYGFLMWGWGPGVVILLALILVLSLLTLIIAIVIPGLAEAVTLSPDAWYVTIGPASDPSSTVTAWPTLKQ